MWFQSIKDRDRLSRELEQTVGDSDLPVLDLTCKKFGLANSFRYVSSPSSSSLPQSLPPCNQSPSFHFSYRNGIYFVFSGKFLTYDQIDAGKYKDLTAQYIDAWFHIERHETALLGPPDPSKTDFDPRARYKNLHKNEVCVACGGTRQYHNSSQCRMKNNPRFKLQCVVCKKGQNPSVRRHQRKRARLERCRRRGGESDEEDEEEEEEESEESDDMFEQDDSRGDENRYCECVDSEGQPFFQCYALNLRKSLRCIETPYIDGIVDQQWKHFDDFEEVYYWFFVLLGRWLFPLSAEWDDWYVVCPFTIDVSSVALTAPSLPR